MSDAFGQLFERVDAGEIAFSYALELARRQIAPTLTREVVQDALRLSAAYVDRRLHQQGLARLQLIAAALEEWDSPEAAELLWRTRIDELNAAAGSLTEIADAGVYARALRSGEELLAVAEQSGDPKRIAIVSRRLGVLHLDPYMTNHLSTAYAMSHQRWLLTAAKKKGASLRSEDEVQLPPPVDALDKATAYLRRAADLTEGHVRGLNLKALAEAMTFRRIAASEDDYVTPEIAAVAQEALDLIDADEDPDAAAVVQQLVTLGGGTAAASLDERAVSELFQRDPRRALTVLLARFAGAEPQHALQALIESRELFERFGGEAERTQRWQQMMRSSYELLKQVAVEARGRTFPQALEIVETKAPGPELVAWSLLGYAGNSTEHDLEAEGQQAVQHAANLLHDQIDSVGDFLAYLMAALSFGLGSNAFNRQQWVAAIERYSDAMRGYIALALPDAARQCVQRILDAAEDGYQDDRVPGAVLEHLGLQVLSIEALDDTGASRALRQIIKRIVTAMAWRRTLKVEWLNLAMQVVKGARLARLLASKARGTGEDPTAMLEAVAAAEGNAGDEAIHGAGGFFDELVLLSYVSTTERESGDTPGERLRNLQRAFDQRYNDHLLGRAGVHPALFSFEAMQERLADDAVLVNYYLGAAPSGNTAVYMTMYTRDGTWLSLIDGNSPDGIVNLGSGEGDGETRAHPLAFVVQPLREHIQHDPGPGAITADGAAELHGYMPLFFGHLLPRLEELSASGKRVLYVVPHGPLHFVPFHLLGGESPLADRWTVVAVPNLALATYTPPEERAPNAVAAVGMSFVGENRWGLGEMQEAADEARAIAEIFGSEALIDDAATHDAVLAAMSEARYVHISSHGVHNVAAPGFQAIFLAPDATSDGRLFAWEVSALDLRHVELVTLSACETALGRFDEADNLRGLPASFFLAGAGAIIGTLWPAEVHSSRQFFTTLYAALAEQAPIVDAFRTAQQETRKRHPQYRDWGAFYLMRSPLESALRPLGD